METRCAGHSAVVLQDNIYAIKNNGPLSLKLPVVFVLYQVRKTYTFLFLRICFLDP